MRQTQLEIEIQAKVPCTKLCSKDGAMSRDNLYILTEILVPWKFKNLPGINQEFSLYYLN